MNRPLIGVTGDYDPAAGRYYLKQEYMEAIWLNGGVPVILEPRLIKPEDWSGDREEWISKTDVPEEILSRVDGVMFTGGNDVDPLFYGEEAMVQNGEVTPFRDVFEIKLARICKGRGIPSLGLCRGIQLMAASLGVKLTQDIAKEEGSSVQHQQKAPAWYPTHFVRFTEGSRLFEIYGSRGSVNSFHHQAIKKGMDPYPFEIIGISEKDGIIEAFELKDHPYFIGVQWHPERMMQDPLHRALFKSFVDASARWAGIKDRAASEGE